MPGRRKYEPAEVYHVEVPEVRSSDARREQVPPESVQGSAMNWEYCMVVKQRVSDKHFNDLGDNGWELVGFDADGDAWFKRPRKVA
jgi:hypothetical protein